MIKLNSIVLLIVLLISTVSLSDGNAAVFPGADEKTPSRAQYFSWINNTNEGSTEKHTLINLEFFQWLHDQYGMTLDIYAFDAGALDGKRFYGDMRSKRFKTQFPNSFTPIYEKAAQMNTRLGIWGGPDGFGNSPADQQTRIEQMVGLCKDFNFALFKFDSVCGPLRPEKESAFIQMMTQARRHSPDLILLNHRLGLRDAEQYATTFLWEGRETYIDVFSTNRVTAPHHRADALSRGLPPDLKRLTEDHGVCISSCPDYWDDDLILQAFNRNLILSPQIYGNPWLLRDDEFPKLARIYNLHRKYRKILVKGIILPETQYGPSAVSRGDQHIRLITLRNLTWEPVTYTVNLDHRIGLKSKGDVHVRRFHPTERLLGTFKQGDTVTVEVEPFRTILLYAGTTPCSEPGVSGVDFDVIRNIEQQPVIIKLKAMPGTKTSISLSPNSGNFSQAQLDDIDAPALVKGKPFSLQFPGEKQQQAYHRKLADPVAVPVPQDAEALYEATIFAADNNALEVRAFQRSGPSSIPQVQAAQEAFFNQPVFKQRGIWDQNLFDGDMTTGFWPSWKYKIDQKVQGGCLRLDIGEVTDIEQLVLHVPDDFSLQPLLTDEGNHVEISTDLRRWKQLTYLAGNRIVIEPGEPVRYFRIQTFPRRIMEIEGFQKSIPLSRAKWRASNLFAHPDKQKPLQAHHSRFTLKQYLKGSYLCIAINGQHGEEGAIAALKIDDQYIGCPDRAASYPSNTWEYINARRDKNYTYYIPVTKPMINKPIDVYILTYNNENTPIKPSICLTAHPTRYKEKTLTLHH